MLTILIIFGSFSILWFIYSVYYFLWLRHIYYHHRENTKEIINEMQKIADRLCLDENASPIEFTLTPLMAYNPKYLASFSRRRIKVFVSPTVGFCYYTLSKPIRNKIILEIVAHELCHYIQYLEHSILTRKLREREAQEIGKLYALYCWKRLE